MKKIIYALSAFLFFTACDKDDNTTKVDPVISVTVTNLPADTIIGITPGAPPSGGMPYGAGKYTFFSLERGVVVPATDSASNKWDIAFKGSTILTNSGNGGPGVGGAFVYIGLFNDLKTIPSDSTFRTENVPTSYAIPLGSNKGWYVYDGLNNLITPIPGRVLVIRTATGKFAKIEILNYYKGGVTPAASASDNVKMKDQRYYSFRYSYQSNGSKVF
jgi:hypothetical protein